MSDLSEAEIFDCMVDNLKIAIQSSEELAIVNLKGPVYNRLREALKLIEGSCRQASVWRQDTRWLNFGRLCAECHAKAGGWLRGHKDPISGIRVPVAATQKNRLFVMLADNLRNMLTAVEQVRVTKTGKVGMILPDTPEATRRIGRPVQGHALAADGYVSRGGIILPPGARLN